jgi:hypothetical protein
MTDSVLRRQSRRRMLLEGAQGSSGEARGGDAGLNRTRYCNEIQAVRLVNLLSRLARNS